METIWLETGEVRLERMDVKVLRWTPALLNENRECHDNLGRYIWIICRFPIIAASHEDGHVENLVRKYLRKLQLYNRQQIMSKKLTGEELEAKEGTISFVSTSPIGDTGGGFLGKQSLAILLLMRGQSYSSRPLHLHVSNLAAFVCRLKMLMEFLHLWEHFLPSNMSLQYLW